MQTFDVLVTAICAGRKDISVNQAKFWAKYLLQLKGCHLFSVASPEKDQAEWLRERCAGIGGSEIAAVLGENHWTSPRQIWMSKVGMFDDKKPTQSEAARWGNLLETTVATEWGVRENRKWVHIPVILQSDTYSYLLANIDGFTLSDDGEQITGILEIKTTSAYNEDAWRDGPLPYNYICQTTWYCGITGLDNFTIVCLVGGQKLYHYELPISTDLFEEEKAAANVFWNQYVVPKIEPPATAADAKLVDKPTEESAASPLILTSEDDDKYAEAYVQATQKEAELKKLKETIKARFMLKMKDNTCALTNAHTISVSFQSRKSCDLEKLADNYPDAFKECISTTSSPRYSIK